MSEPFLAEVRIVGFSFAPRGWAFCDGQILPIDQHQSLYSLLGTTYGGDGRTTFGLPDMRGRTPIHVGGGHNLGQRSGEETVVLGTPQIPAHTHTLHATPEPADSDDPTDWPATASSATANRGQQATTLAGGASTGGGQGHENMQPFLALNYCIALQGLFPSQN